MNVEIGDIVPYVNKRGNVAKAKVEQFVKVPPNDKIWFNGIDINTNAKVHYPVERSKEIQSIGWVLGEPPQDRFIPSPPQVKRPSKKIADEKPENDLYQAANFERGQGLGRRGKNPAKRR